MQIDRPIAIALTLFTVLLLMFFLVVPEYNTFKELGVDLSEKKAEYAAEFDYYAAISKTYFDLQNRKDDVKKIDDALPQDANFADVIYFLQKSAKENGLIVKSLFLSKSFSTSSDTDINGGVKDITFSMDISGDYISLENFIISLEKSSRIFEIVSISFTSASGPPYSFNLQIKTHSY
ncbi:MAG: type 4a pilus biogenesis protein PilO [Candidatus Staskawiczbacteria bacterium]|nr:type 4a pilus biogenesis protein PilO [Candidatus Staskawiczbacteria bacterium]